MSTTTVKIGSLTPDPMNANRGTERGQQFIESSLRKYGAGRSILIDKHGKIIAGNKTAENAGAIGLEDVLVVQTDGTKLVAVQRMDLDLNDPKTIEMAIADNRSGQVSLDFDPDVLAELSTQVDLSQFWSEKELNELLAHADEVGMPELASGDKEPFQQMTFTLHDSQAKQVTAAMARAKGMGPFTDSPNENSNGNALARICETFLTQNGNS